MLNKLILASKSKVRKDILERNSISCDVQPSNVDEEIIKEGLLNENASPELISKNLAELKANKVSSKNPDKIVLGADSVIDLQGELISKPKSRQEAFEILKKLNGKKHRAADVITKEEADEHIANGAEILGTQWVDTDKNEHLKPDQKGSPDTINPFQKIMKSEGYVPNYKSRHVARGDQ